MDFSDFSNIKLGILGGGQLGKMLCLEASKWNIDTFVLDPSDECPASSVCKFFFQGDFRDFDKVVDFGGRVDLLTIEIEHVNVDALELLEENGMEVRPSSKILRTIKDKELQKNFYTEHNLPTSQFRVFYEKNEILRSLKKGLIKYPFVQKLCKDGYDGRGVCIIKNENDVKGLLEGKSIVERLVPIRKELSVIVSQNKFGEVRCFPPFEMVFDNEANLVDYLFSPAKIDPSLASLATDIAEKTIKAFNLYGILAVEMFIDKNNNLLINEVAPRPHNSGHHTIESFVTSQYEQHIRSVFDFSLGVTDQIIPSVLLNLLGEPGYEGVPKYVGLKSCLKIDGAKFHIYGKKKTRPYRKMGHVTIIDKDIDRALEKAKFIKEKVRIVS